MQFPKLHGRPPSPNLPKQADLCYITGGGFGKFGVVISFCGRVIFRVFSNREVATEPAGELVRTGDFSSGETSFHNSGSPEASSSSSSSTSSTTSFPAPNLCLVYASQGQSQTAESLLGNLSIKKQKKKPTEQVDGGVGAPRRCSHCGVTKTPQWRAGPLGAKTLCNACGVRYKSGRLLPEYRPVCSPTFSSELHSNNHQKVLEIEAEKGVGAGRT
ncbi:GATA transcription factor [Forsythia ovata]|uniref:GATA transcription factor n=1 Tax=Forsythia ovata TaxID=205694 RepID=A0ABD1RMG4_9LAMI